MSSARAIVLFLAIVLGGGSAWLDSCLAGCGTLDGGPHRAKASRSHCHDASESPAAGQHWQSTSHCTHDHGVLSAETREVRLNESGKSVATATTQVFTPSTNTEQTDQFHARLSTARLTHFADGSPLRI